MLFLCNYQSRQKAGDNNPMYVPHIAFWSLASLSWTLNNTDLVSGSCTNSTYSGTSRSSAPKIRSAIAPQPVHKAFQRTQRSLNIYGLLVNLLIRRQVPARDRLSN